MSSQQLGSGPLHAAGPGPHPEPAGPGGSTPAPSPPARFVGWLGGLGGAAAGYGMFQFLFEVLPDSLSGQLAKYLIAGVSGLGTAAAGWLAAALLRARAGRPAYGTVSGSAPAPAVPAALPQVCHDAYGALAEQVTVVDDPELGRLTGWAHSLGETVPPRPTPVGTAYGLHIVLDLGVPDGRLRAGDLVDTLWRLRLPDGGWSARSQGLQARPEITALVLGALARAGVSEDRLAPEVARCVAGFTLDQDPAGWASVHVVTTVLRGLLRAAPGSALLPELREAVVDGALDDPGRDHLRCWGYRLRAPYGPPSPVHTAQAVVALDRAGRVLGENAAARAAREDGVRWLLACPEPRHDVCGDLAHLREEVRRPRADDPTRHEVLYVRHFTAAWVVRALLTPTAGQVARADGLEAAWRERLAGAVAAVWAGQSGGIWTWGPGEQGAPRQPLWMTYQGLSALRAHAVSMYRPGH
ncbi:hypothetical protein [Streptomyces thermodiastaticus]|uniref:hypothetical protein n=1 Tax=Streptomyces thermodiastaticus TaxID=44061 RepID=UPI0016790BB1|nr:hypothetical protein [Streptomyces thermodiastaticus]MCE7549171.1 hypothetical protein [Streptomyces thermodiastaticus]GHF60695.1 hypothetical protein GCM10018787_06100 [Streptomyces thermodiastaticus]